MSDGPRLTVLWDGNCGFCRRFIDAARARTADRVDYLPYQDAAGRFPQLDGAALAQAMHTVAADGGIRRGAAAVFATLAMAPGWGWLDALYARSRLWRQLSEAVYATVARQRGRLAPLVHWGDRAAQRGDAHARTARWFLAGLGLVYAVAFASLWPQLDTLWGPRGLQPMAAALERARNVWGGADVLRVPSVFWWGAGVAAQRAVLVAGLLAALLLMCGRLRRPSLIVAWVAYASFVSAGGAFMSFQWDHLLLEAGAAALLLPRRDRGRATASLVGLWTLRWLLLRLMLSSGLVKVFSGDPSWLDGTAMTYHYQTQPLPNALAWFAQQLPRSWHWLETMGTLAGELAAPLLVLCGRRARTAAAAVFAVLMAGIGATGNYGFFNLLALVLCLTLLDDARLKRMRWRGRASAPEQPARGLPPLWPFPGPWRVLLAAALVAASAAPLWRAVRRPPPAPLQALAAPFASLRLVNGYGLFATMTKERPELVFATTSDGRAWHERELRFKPGDPQRRPAQVAPHMPRVDWQLWFAALGGPRRHPWVFGIARGLCRNDGEVTSLFAADDAPIGAAPLQAVRILQYDYRFTTIAERDATGAWWQRQLRGTWGPELPCAALR